MTQPNGTLPKYFKDETGFCYNATPLLGGLTTMTPWAGGVDANGYAVDEPEAKPTKSRPARLKSATAEDLLPAAPTDEA